MAKSNKSGEPASVISTRDKSRSLVLCCALFFTLLIYPVLGMVWHHSYPLLSPELGLIVIAAATISFFLSALILSTRSLVTNLVVTLFVTIGLMIQFNLFFEGLTIVFTMGLILGFLLKDRYIEFVLAVFVAMLMGSWLDSRLDPATKLAVLQPEEASSGRGPVIHVLMDGFMAPEGLPWQDESQKLRAEIMSFFKKYGFELHTRAYSHYSSTLNSMTRAFNFTNDDQALFRRAEALREDLAFRDNAWFEVLSDAGYPIHVYQSESVDFCHVATIDQIQCNVFPIPNLKTVNREIDDVRTRLEVLLRTLVSQSEILTKILRNARILDTWGVSIYDERLLPKLTADIQSRPGDAFFSHLLIPHSPFVFTEDCDINYRGESRTRWAYIVGNLASDSESQNRRYEKYIAQSHCAIKLLGQLFDTLITDNLFDKATIIIHGDHGSSAYNHSPHIANFDLLTQRDLLDAFSTLFAVKWPGGESEIIGDVESLNVLMAKMARKFAGHNTGEMINAVTSEPEPFIYLTGMEPLRQIFVNIYGGPDQGRESE